MENPYKVDNCVLLTTIIYNFVGLLDESSNSIKSSCPGSMLWITLIVAIGAHYYAHEIGKLDLKPLIKILSVFIFGITEAIIFSQLIVPCTKSINNTLTYWASILNVVVIGWYLGVSIREIILVYGTNNSRQLQRPQQNQYVAVPATVQMAGIEMAQHPQHPQHPQQAQQSNYGSIIV